MTAQQVVNSFQRSMDLGQGGAYIWDAVLESNGGKVEATGEYEVTITCGYPWRHRPDCLRGYAAYVMSDSVIEQPTEWFNEGPRRRHRPLHHRSGHRRQRGAESLRGLPGRLAG